MTWIEVGPAICRMKMSSTEISTSRPIRGAWKIGHGRLANWRNDSSASRIARPWLATRPCSSGMTRCFDVPIGQVWTSLMLSLESSSWAPGPR